jgi:curved DNA-binding protein CbpA
VIEDTYYVVLGVPEGATQDEVKRAYRQLIRQVHPDSVPNASPYWKQAAEEKSKEINEAYHVLTDANQRASYDAQLAKYRQQIAPAAKVEVTPPASSQARSTASRSRARKRRYNWQPLKHWAGEYPFLASCLFILFLLPVVSVFVGLIGTKRGASNRSGDSEGYYSAFACLDLRDTVSPIDGKPCRRPEGNVIASGVAQANPAGQDNAVPAQTGRAAKSSGSPKWFYTAADGVHQLPGTPGDDTCQVIGAASSSACRTRLKFCPRGVWSKDCVAYSTWEKNKNVDPPRVEKSIPAWPSQ